MLQPKCVKSRTRIWKTGPSIPRAKETNFALSASLPLLSRSRPTAYEEGGWGWQRGRERALICLSKRIKCYYRLYSAHGWSTCCGGGGVGPHHRNDAQACVIFTGGGGVRWTGVFRKLSPPWTEDLQGVPCCQPSTEYPLKQHVTTVHSMLNTFMASPWMRCNRLCLHCFKPRVWIPPGILIQLGGQSCDDENLRVEKNFQAGVYTSAQPAWLPTWETNFSNFIIMEHYL